MLIVEELFGYRLYLSIRCDCERHVSQLITFTLDNFGIGAEHSTARNPCFWGAVVTLTNPRCGDCLKTGTNPFSWPYPTSGNLYWKYFRASLSSP